MNRRSPTCRVLVTVDWEPPRYCGQAARNPVWFDGDDKPLRPGTERRDKHRREFFCIEHADLLTAR